MHFADLHSFIADFCTGYQTKQPDTGELKELSEKISHSCGLDEGIVSEELRVSETLGKYVGFRSFVLNVLDKIKGYPYQAGYSVINKIKE